MVLSLRQTKKILGQGRILVISHLAQRGAAIFVTCRRLPLFLIVLVVAVPLMPMQASAQGQTGASRLQDIPGPSALWFLDPLMPRLSNPSPNMDPVTIELTNRANKVIALRIPRAYIAEISEPREIVQTYVTLAVYFPD